MSEDHSPSRRRLLGRGALLLAAVAAATPAAAGSKTAKADVKYQFTPNSAARCGLCASFIAPSGGGTGPGSCKIVDGPIPQDGWCLLFSPAAR